MARRNLLAAVVLLTIGLAYGLLTARLPNRGLPNTPGPAFFPWLIAGTFVALSAGLLIRGLTRLRDDPAGAPPARITHRGWLALLIFLAYLVLLPNLGFLAASIPFFAALTWLYGERNRLVVALTAFVVPALLFFIFRDGFQMLLPRGAWW